MSADLVDQSTGDTQPAATAGGAGLDERTGAGAQPAADEIKAIRERIDEIDNTLIALWQERSRLSQHVGRTRMASGGTRLVLSREREIVDRFREALGPDGTQVALLLLRAGRGPL
ncbi:chorismate mutase [Actinoplanes sp. N902-109]|uniref:chorismate mutase n=1 Tax=Actinoplanes sp. (strain N902-109) TaxID=649831 RepID=UPI0003296683|nr:chorismate mutase [Actinoplanes sp. N902-109]AGL14550.1 chorismate mutase [Actinoplanes sp. N902-109]